MEKEYYLYIFTGSKKERYVTVSVEKEMDLSQLWGMLSDIADVEHCDENKVSGITFELLKLNGDELDAWFEDEANSKVYVMFPPSSDDSETDSSEESSDEDIRVNKHLKLGELS